MTPYPRLAARLPEAAPTVFIVDGDPPGDESRSFDFLTKWFTNDVLLYVLRKALERSCAALRHLSQTRALEQRYESLSRREREVMRLVVAGRLNKQVGGDLGISEITYARA